MSNLAPFGAIGLGLIALLISAGAGCSGTGKVKKVEAEQRVGAEAFARSASESPVADPVDEQEPLPEPVVTDRDESFVVRSAQPTNTSRAEPVAPDGLSLIEAKIGDVNGKPIYITSFFEPIEARLIAEADQLRLAAWRVAAMSVIRERLDGMIMDELLRAEALAALSEGQRQGLRSFLSDFRRNTLSQNLGSAELANQRGQNLNDAIREKEIETLVSLTLFQEVNKLVNVSWRDIQQRYERDYETYNPPPTAVFRLMRLMTDDEAVVEMGSRIARGEEFEILASEDINTHKPAEGGLHEAVFEEPYAEAEFFGSDALNEKARSLSPGQITGPFELGRFTCWLKLETIRRESTSLYEAQLAINYELTQERRTKTRTEYFNRLFERARVSNREAMLMELLRVAEERYGPE